MTLRIFVEGIADRKFIEDYVSHKYKKSLKKEEIIETRGWSNIYSHSRGEVIKNQMMKNSDDDGVNLLIFDADTNHADRLAVINKWKADNELEFHTFLWPNDSDSGDLEVALEQIINQNNNPIFECWDKYENCLKEIVGRELPLTTPARKTKIYGYLEALLGESEKDRIKERNRNYKELKHWNLDSEYLSPLNFFLDTFLLKSIVGNNDS